jgi:hypothetical protein
MLTNPLILAAALEGLELKLARINAMIAEIKGQGSKSAVSAVAAPAAKKPRRKRRELSPEARQRMADAQKKRWAKARKAKGK